MAKKLVVAVVVLILAVAGWRLYQAVFGGEQAGGQAGPAVAVELTPVQRKSLEDKGRFTGTLRPRSQFIAAPKIGGRLEQVLVDIGDEVEYNQLIAVLDDDEYALQARRAEADLEVSRAALEEARSSMEVARRELERVESLFGKQIASEADHDIARNRFVARRAGYEVALAELDQREAALQEARVRLEYTRVRAAWGEGGHGRRVVGERFRYEGSMLSANTPIVSILDINSLLAVIHVVERDYAKVRPGMTARLTTDAFPDTSFTGRVVRIAPRLEETSRQARTEIEVPNPGSLLKPGMFVRVEITFGVHEDVPVVPSEAITRRGEHEGVFVAEADNLTARFVPVRTGIENDGLVEIVEPADFEGRVVSLGQHLLEDGGAINPAAEEGR